MKKRKFLVFSLILTLFGTSCSNKDKVYIEQKENIDSFVYVNNSDLTTLINNKQDFILVVGENGCLTCDIIKPVITEYIKKYEYIIYWIETKQYQNVVDKFVNSEEYSLRADIMSATIILFDNGITKEIIPYTENLYYSDSKLELTLENKVTGSHIYTLNKLEKFDYSKNSHMYKFDLSSTEELDSLISSSEKANILYSWGPCPDCIRFKDEVVNEYMSSSSNKLYIYEVSHFRNDYSTNPELFTTFASKYQFDNYRGGKVPCIVTYKNGTKDNMHVYFNDEFEKLDDESYKIKNSFIPSLVNTTYSSGEKMFKELKQIHKEKTIEYLENNL